MTGPETPGRAAISPAFARWYRIGLPLASDDTLAAAWANQHEAERAFWAEVDTAQRTAGITVEALTAAIAATPIVVKDGKATETRTIASPLAAAVQLLARIDKRPTDVAAQELPAPGLAAAIYEAYRARIDAGDPWPLGGPGESEDWEVLGDDVTAWFDDMAQAAARAERGRLRNGITEVTRSADATRPSRKTEVEDELAIALRRLLDPE